jgi:response regulator RpfG family c-di-GMP phosphodiesterase
MARILVVDDRAVDREYLETLLRYAGHFVATAADGEEALQIARGQKQDLAIVDIVMPTMDGLEFVNRLRNDPTLAELPVIFYSASYLRSEAERLAVSSHVQKVVSKPAEPEVILQAVADMLGTAAAPLPVQPAKVKSPESDALLSVTLHKTKRELESISQRFAMLVEFGREFAAASDPNRLLERLTSAARSVVGARYAVVAILHKGGQSFSRMFTSGVSANVHLPVPYPSPTSGPLGDGIRSASISIRRVYEIRPDDLGLPAHSQPVSTLMSVPIAVAGRTLGLLCLVNKLGGDDFTVEESKIAETLVAHVGVAYENLRLMRETESRLEFVNALRAIDIAITGSLDLHLTLDVVLDQVVTHLGVDAATILLLNHGSNYLETVAVRGFRSHAVVSRHMKLGDGHAGVAALERRFIGFGSSAAAGIEGAGPQMVDGEQFEAYYVAPLVSKGRILGVLEIMKRDPLEPDQEWLDFVNALASQAAIAIDEAELFSQLQRANDELTLAYDSTLEGWVHALDLRDKETEGHTQRVTELTLALARSAGFSDQELVHVRRGALLHDIGKLGIPDAILLKPGQLTDEEWVVMKLHPVFAYEWLKPIPYLRPALDIPYNHHEKWDGSGYPRGIAGESIPPASRLFSVVDIWDAVTSDRPYRAAWSTERANDHLRSLSGAHLEPFAVDAFFKLPEAVRSKGP